MTFFVKNEVFMIGKGKGFMTSTWYYDFSKHETIGYQVISSPQRLQVSDKSRILFFFFLQGLYIVEIIVCAINWRVFVHVK